MARIARTGPRVRERARRRHPHVLEPVPGVSTDGGDPAAGDPARVSLSHLLRPETAPAVHGLRDCEPRQHGIRFIPLHRRGAVRLLGAGAGGHVYPAENARTGAGRGCEE